MQIRAVGSERQSVLKGNVVNVDIDLDTSAKVLPRNPRECRTVHVQLMRRMSYSVPYMEERIRPRKFYEAVKYLMTTELYIKEGVTLCDDWSIYDDGILQNLLIYHI